MKVRKTTRDAAWLEVALSDTAALLSDHAHCEKKAASSAISLIARYPEASSMVTALADLAREELEHFAEVHQALVARGGVLGVDVGDPYVQRLVKLAQGETRAERIADRLLISALVEARSFERLALLGEHHPDPTLAEMFARFARTEAHHGALFVGLAREHGPSREHVDERLAELLDHELAIIESHPLRCAIH